MNFNLGFFVYSFFVSIISGYSQIASLKDTNQRLFLCMANMPKGFAKNIKKYKTPNCLHFSNEDIDPTNTRRINQNHFKKVLNTRVPNKNYKGILILDWENEGFDSLREGKPYSKMWNQTVDNFVAALRYAKKLRPKAQWGFWNIPLAIYFVKVDTFWDDRIDATETIIKECDVLLPSLYDVYPTGAVSWQDDTAFITSNLEKSLQMGIKYNKPVLPFVWHRYSDAVKESGLISIEPKEFANQMALIKSVTYKRRKVSGVIWWQEDLYFINIKSKNVLNEMVGKTQDNYRDEVLIKYFGILKKLFE